LSWDDLLGTKKPPKPSGARYIEGIIHRDEHVIVKEKFNRKKWMDENREKIRELNRIRNREFRLRKKLNGRKAD
jgi:hypothetical protein